MAETKLTDARELGMTGLRRQGGYIYEEFLRELQGQRGAKTFRTMADNDDICGAILYALEMLMRQVSWRFEADPDAGDAAKKLQDTFSGMLFEDMQSPWSETLSEILQMLVYGYSLLEVTYKKREGDSTFSDGLIGWAHWGVRAQETIDRWEFDENGRITGAWQRVDTEILLPAERCLLFRTSTRRGNPEGRSLLRNAYRSWYFKRRMQEIEGIGVERDLAGLPVMTAPEGLPIFDDAYAAQRQSAEQLVRNIRRDEQEGVLMPFGWKLELLGSSSKRQFDTTQIITRYDQRMAMTVLADFILIGHDAVGSKALSANKTKIFGMAVNGLLDLVEDVVNRVAIPRLAKRNGFDLQAVPMLKHGDASPMELSDLSTYLQQLGGAGAVLFPNPALERHLLEIAKLPTPDPAEPMPSEVVEAQQAEQRELEAESMRLALAQQQAGLGAGGGLEGA